MVPKQKEKEKKKGHAVERGSNQFGSVFSGLSRFFFQFFSV